MDVSPPKRKRSTVNSDIINASDVLQKDWSWAQRERFRDSRRKRKIPINQNLEDRIKKKLELSKAQLTQRKTSVPSVTVDPVLPISAHAELLVEAIERHQVIIVAGATGSGKSTQIPKLCLAAGRGVRGLIGCTQPRRIAARSVASRVAEELQVEMGSLVGYQVRFTDQTADSTLIKFMTDGILLAEAQRDRYFDQYDTIIIDEAHERSLNIDFLLGLLRRVLPKRPDLRVIVTSATIDTERFSAFFNTAPVVEVEGRTYPVELRYRPLDEISKDRQQNRNIYKGVAEAVDELSRIDSQGDVLVFLPGEREIREAQTYLQRRHLKHTEVLPLYARLSAQAQMQIFKPGPQRRIVLATNVAETSLTVPRIRFVVDAGLARISRYSHRSRIQRLPIEAVSQASANQRSGRCGRLGPGVAIRLYAEDDFELRPEFTEPEILRTSLATVILRMLNMRLGDINDFPFIEAPAQVMINDGVQLLYELQCVENHQDALRLSREGQQLASLPMDVRLARMLQAASTHDCISPVLTLTAALSIQDPRERPFEKTQAADEAHSVFAHKQSDFISLLNLWHAFQKARAEHGSAALRRWCEQHFISWLRMREWQDLRRQLREQIKPLGWQDKPVEHYTSADYENIHRALLTGMLSNIGLRDDTENQQATRVKKRRTPKSYTGARGRQFHIFPGSDLIGSVPKWLMTAEIVETSRVYARTCAVIKPEWLEEQAAHLLKHRYFDPFWDARRGQVMGYCQSTLYGLTLIEKRKVHYAPHDPETARKVFIQHGLLTADLELGKKPRPEFLSHNQQLLTDLQQEEHKRRRHDILERDEVRLQFYAKQLPAEVLSTKTLLAWLSQDAANDSKLRLNRTLLMRAGAELGHVDAFPEKWLSHGHELRVTYHFEPGHENDGVTLYAPVEQLNLLDAAQLSWLVPGLLEEKLAALITTLPKPQRRRFTPVKQFARAAYEAILTRRDTVQQKSITETLGKTLSRMTGDSDSRLQFDVLQLPVHLQMRIVIIDKTGKTIASGRNLQKLQEQHGQYARQQFMRQQGQQFNRDGITDWNFGVLPDEVTTPSGVIAWPALVADSAAKNCKLRLFDDQDEAWHQHQAGVALLVRIALSASFNYIRKSHGFTREMQMQAVTLDGWQAVRDDLTEQLLGDLDSGIEPRDEAAFRKHCSSIKQQLLPAWQQRLRILEAILAIQQQVRKRLSNKAIQRHVEAHEDMQLQLDDLLYPGCFATLGWHAFQHYPRYLEAMTVRLQRLSQDPGKDSQRQQLVRPYWQHYLDCIQAGVEYSEEMDEFRWLIEEFRVSLFAQQLGTNGKVSATRLDKAWQDIQNTQPEANRR